MGQKIDYRAAFQAMPTPCALLSRELKVIAANAAYLETVGLSSTSLIGRRLPEALGLPDAEDARALLDALYAPFFHGRTETAGFSAAWPRGTAAASQRWRCVNIPLKGTSGDFDVILHCVDADDKREGAAPAPQDELTVRDAVSAVSGPDRLLLVMDDAGRRRQAATALQSAGHTVDTAVDIASALDALAADPAIELAIIDVKAPLSTFVKPALSLIDELDILAACEPTQAAGVAAQGSIALSRPYTVTELESSVRHLLRNRQQRMLLRQATHGTGEPARAARVTATELRILLVEDNHETRQATADLLELLGHQVTAVGDAEQALTLLAEGDAFDVLCTDLRLPGASGLTLAQHARGDSQRLAIVFVSGDEGIDATAQASLRAVKLRKPYTLDSLEGALHAAIGAARQ